MTYTIEKVTTLIGARRYGDRDGNVGFILTDSRSLCFPEETLFFALKSERNDGHNYIPELYRRGVRNFVVSRYLRDMPPIIQRPTSSRWSTRWRLSSVWQNVIVMSSTFLLWALRVPMARRWSRSGSISCSRPACLSHEAHAATIPR